MIMIVIAPPMAMSQTTATNIPQVIMVIVMIMTIATMMIMTISTMMMMMIPINDHGWDCSCNGNEPHHGNQHSTGINQHMMIMTISTIMMMLMMILPRLGL